jgi:hypothetical protein
LYDVVSGWRKNRKDAPIGRNFTSRPANRLISRIPNDYGCTLKAYRREKAMARHLAPDIPARREKGIGIPLAKWLRRMPIPTSVRAEIEVGHH